MKEIERRNFVVIFFIFLNPIVILQIVCRVFNIVLINILQLTRAYRVTRA